MFVVYSTKGGIQLNPNYNRTKRCSYCGEEIAFDDRRCPYCCSLLNDNQFDTSSFYGNDFVQPYYNGWYPPADNVYNSNQYNQVPPIEPSPIAPQPEMTQNQVFITPEMQGWNNIQSQPIQNNSVNTNPEENAFTTRFKVFLTAACSVVPGLGQLAGIIISIILLNSEDSEDKRKFGASLMLASVVTFAFQCIMIFLLVIALSPYTL